MINFLTSINLFYVIIFVFIAGAVGSLLLKNDDKIANFWGNTAAIIGSSLGILFSGLSLLSGTTYLFGINTEFQLFSLSFRIDPLSAFFILVISLIGLLCSVYAIDYIKHYYKKYSIGVLGFLYNIFIVSMILVTTAHNALFFLVVWELMSITSYFLVIYERNEISNIKAGSLYFIMTHIGTAFIILSFLLMYSLSSSFEFDVIKNSLLDATPLMKDLIFLTALIGFGTKAGIIPLHIWLPSAHPAAPSHVSALMSGVMIKTGIYMIIRVSLDLLPNAPLWWGVIILIIGSVSSLLGVLYALSEHDIKKLLAYHSIENIGIILLGLGSALIFSSAGMYAFAALGLVAALYHTINHASFKALLFLSAGSVIAETHTRNMEEYGGLIKYMPQTAFFFLIGAMAISALPPFNGFFSEWLTFQSLFAAVSQFDILTKLILLFSIGSLAFTGGLAAACFVKAFGITFLARPRSEEVKHAKESSLLLRLGMGGLALLIILLGFFSNSITQTLNSVSLNLINFPESLSAINTQWGSVNIRSFATVSMPIIYLILMLTLAAVIALVYLVSRKQKTTRGLTWDCGTSLTSRMEITATGFSRSFVVVFKDILQPHRETETEYHDDNLKYFPKASTITLELSDIYFVYIYYPLQRLILRIAEQIKRIQIGNINTYILYIFITLIGILFVLAL